MPAVMYSQQWLPAPSMTAVAPGVAHGEPVAGLTGGEQQSAGGPVERRVAQHQVLVRLARVGRAAEVPDRDLPARQSLADVVVGLALELEVHALGEESPEALAGAAR